MKRNEIKEEKWGKKQSKKMNENMTVLALGREIEIA